MEQIAGLVRVIYLSENIKKHTQTAIQQLNIYRVPVTHEQSIERRGGERERTSTISGELLPELCGQHSLATAP